MVGFKKIVPTVIPLISGNDEIQLPPVFNHRIANLPQSASG